MGYKTELFGELRVRPALSALYVKEWNEATFTTPTLIGICPWELTAGGTHKDEYTIIRWEGRKPYDFDLWLSWAVQGITRDLAALNDGDLPRFTGVIEWVGSDADDRGSLHVENDGNEAPYLVSTLARIDYPPENKRRVNYEQEIQEQQRKRAVYDNAL